MAAIIHRKDLTAHHPSHYVLKHDTHKGPGWQEQMACRTTSNLLKLKYVRQAVKTVEHALKKANDLKSEGGNRVSSLATRAHGVAQVGRGP
eukprot:scaffold154936_cov30-Tisochrysis_lutea.AAC.7